MESSTRFTSTPRGGGPVSAQSFGERAWAGLAARNIEKFHSGCSKRIESHVISTKSWTSHTTAILNGIRRETGDWWNVVTCAGFERIVAIFDRSLIHQLSAKE